MLGGCAPRLLVYDAVELLSHRRVQRLQPLVLFCSRALLAKHVIHPAQTKVRVSRFRIELDSLSVFRSRIRVKVQAVVGHAKLVVGLRVVRSQVKRFFVCGHCLLESVRAVMLLSSIKKVCGSSSVC